MKSTVSINIINSTPIISYNSIIGENTSKVEVEGNTYNGFYISYNNHDIDIYGDVTTALVVGQMEKFYILNGDHSEKYKKLIKEGFEKCFEYYKDNIKYTNRHSDKIQNDGFI